VSSFPDNFSATKSSSEGTKSRGEPGVIRSDQTVIWGKTMVTSRAK